MTEAIRGVVMRRDPGGKGFWARFFREETGNIAIVAAVALPVLLAAFGLSFEGAQWYQVRRQIQNAADSAALAASANAGLSYALEAKAVAAQYGFTDGQDSVTVTATNQAACPSGGSNCYQVTIVKPVPIVLMQLVGYRRARAAPRC